MFYLANPKYPMFSDSLQLVAMPYYLVVSYGSVDSSRTVGYFTKWPSILTGRGWNPWNWPIKSIVFLIVPALKYLFLQGWISEISNSPARIQRIQSESNRIQCFTKGIQRIQCFQSFRNLWRSRTTLLCHMAVWILAGLLDISQNDLAF